MDSLSTRGITEKPPSPNDGEVSPPIPRVRRANRLKTQHFPPDFTVAATAGRGGKAERCSGRAVKGQQLNVSRRAALQCRWICAEEEDSVLQDEQWSSGSALPEAVYWWLSSDRKAFGADLLAA
ncbi:hypothetical protein FQA47_015767 [Oryzias melastigma]|uniref:Uncharacterized protein n=1 Tax=Oryzias melastigma TaxID=30732 RepID=A0A834F7P5_ORYME|nr:hypothetical protein FQA47_015767 [Oryzias melastigma]